jgi:hypothetical protein
LYAAVTGVTLYAGMVLHTHWRDIPRVVRDGTRGVQQFMREHVVLPAKYVGAPTASAVTRSRLG